MTTNGMQLSAKALRAAAEAARNWNRDYKCVESWFCGEYPEHFNEERVYTGPAAYG